MSRSKSAFYALGLVVMDLTDDLITIANRDGEIDAAERHVIDGLRYVGRQLERGDRARLKSQMTQNTWQLEDSPHQVRMIRELKADLGGDDGPGDDGAPQLKAA